MVYLVLIILQLYLLDILLISIIWRVIILSIIATPTEHTSMANRCCDGTQTYYWRTTGPNNSAKVTTGVNTQITCALLSIFLQFTNSCYRILYYDTKGILYIQLNFLINDTLHKSMALREKDISVKFDIFVLFPYLKAFPILHML